MVLGGEVILLGFAVACGVILGCVVFVSVRVVRRYKRHMRAMSRDMGLDEDPCHASRSRQWR
jgi:hypothetical protein